MDHASFPPFPSLRPSACPALARIVASRDGGLCRVKLPGGKLSAAQAIAIADAAETFASGVVELTNRANLQLRGVRPGVEAHLSQRLIEDGLGPRITDTVSDAVSRTATRSANPLAEVDSVASSVAPSLAQRTAVADDVRNLMLSATAGCDAGALYDTTPLADALLVLLENEPRFAALSPKFSILLDGGERLAALDHPHDVWLSPMGTVSDSAESVEASNTSDMTDGLTEAPMFVFGLAGQPATGQALAAVRACDVPSLVHALLHTFIDLARDDQKRMRDLLRTHRASDIAQHAATSARVTLHHNAAVDTWQRAPADPLRRFGAWPQRHADLWHIGAQAPLGRLDATTLRALAHLSQTHALGSFRVTPWQGLMMTDVATRDVPAVEQALNGLGLILSADTPLGRLIACAGSTGCAKALSDTKADARALADRLHRSVEVHLSGCVRSCAAAHRAPWTLLAVGAGRYDLYRHTATHAKDIGAHTGNETLSDAAVNDTASAVEPPSGQRLDDTLRFGERIATDMPLEAIALRLNSQDRIDRNFTPDTP